MLKGRKGEREKGRKGEREKAAKRATESVSFSSFVPFSLSTLYPFTLSRFHPLSLLTDGVFFSNANSRCHVRWCRLVCRRGDPRRRRTRGHRPLDAAVRPACARRGELRLMLQPR